MTTTPLRWRKSSYTDNGQCVEIAAGDGRVLVRNSNHPNRLTLSFRPASLAAFIAGCSAGEHDYLA